MPTACILIRGTISYRRDAFERGLQAHGYELITHPRKAPDRGDLLVVWNRRRDDFVHGRAYERAGARTIVAENGYIGADEQGRKLYALALDNHNGAGSWPALPEPRALYGYRWPPGVTLQPWREAGDQIVVLPQRGIGAPRVAMPPGWTGRTLELLRRTTKRPVVLRRHPGPDKTEPYAALRGAHAAVTWGSGAAIKALAVGVPVFHEFPSWIGAPAARLGFEDLENPWLGDRLPMFQRLAWAQWTLAEIESGEAFGCLLQIGQSKATAASPRRSTEPPTLSMRL